VQRSRYAIAKHQPTLEDSMATPIIRFSQEQLFQNSDFPSTRKESKLTYFMLRIFLFFGEIVLISFVPFIIPFSLYY
jgi:hypothetical protein